MSIYDFYIRDLPDTAGKRLDLYTVKCRCNERQYNEMFRIAK